MRINTLLSAILHGAFLLEGAAMQTFNALAVQVLTGQIQASSFEDEEEKEPVAACYALTPHAAGLGIIGYGSLGEVPAGSVAIHTIAGVMLPEDSWFTGMGTRTIGQRILAADAHENIIGHVAVWRTPGGSTMGLESFANIIAGTKKPLVSYAEQMCSAGYWAGSSANGGIVVGGRTAMIGSIGTKIEFLDFTGFYEKLGIKQIGANATASTNKNAAFDQLIAGNAKPIQQELLDPLNEVFLSTVRTNRDGKLDAKKEKELLSGMVYIGQANVDNGLGDMLGTLDDAVNLVAQLAEEANDAGTSSAQSATNSNSHTVSLFAKKTVTLGAAMLALVAKETVTAEAAAAANEDLVAAGITGAALITEAQEQAYETTAQQLTEAQATIKATNDALAAAGATDIAALVKQRDEFEAKAIEYGAKDGDTATTAVRKDGKSDVETPDADASQQLIDELPHNKALDNNPLFAAAK
ncbi:S49 family peptidase [Hymenobacter aerilatus]|uniref:S49 family peptidase n=1 Tax=Hymenobacter aerilatus TaxID=2932251 RepID=A0A8T9SWY0_9BACT|nr:S49 family peptidase [Hymenobacter aerilatus]UOR06732.1 S49 family peptidase [Hymenobacter aerilatus]